MAAARSDNTRPAEQAALTALVTFSDYSVAQSDFVNAREAIMQAQGLLPNSAFLTAKLIRVELAAGQIKEADKLFESLKAEEPPGNGIDLLQADILITKGKKAEAYTFYQKAWQAKPTDQTAQKIVSITRELHPDKLEVFLKEWASKMPQSTYAQTLSGNFYLEAGQTDKAISHFQKAIEVQPKNAMAMNNLAWLYFTQKKMDKARELGEKAVELAPQNAAIMDTLGWILVNSGDKSRGKAILEEAVKLAPDNAEIQEHLKAAE